MPVRLWCSYFNGAGTPLYLDVVRVAGSRPPTLDPRIARIATQKFTETVNLAFQSTLRVIGWPVGCTFRIDFEPVAPVAAPLPGRLDGGSHYGAVAIGLAQAVVRAEPDCLRYAARPLRPMLESVCLDWVAVSAAHDPDIDSFKPVGCMADKLESFCIPQVQHPAVCVVAMGQSLDARCTPPMGNAPEQGMSDRYIPLNREGFLPVLRAYDATDALLRLWEAQSKTLANYL